MRRPRSTRSVPAMSADTSARQEVAVGDVVLRYDEQGSGEPPLLLLHGFTGAALDFVDVIPALAAARRVVAYDQRGHGDSTNTGDASTYTFDQLTADLASFADARVSATPFDLLGHSMGGIISLRYVLALSGARALVGAHGHGCRAGREARRRVRPARGARPGTGDGRGVRDRQAVLGAAGRSRRAGGTGRDDATRRVEVHADGSGGLRCVRGRAGRVPVDGRAAR